MNSKTRRSTQSGNLRGWGKSLPSFCEIWTICIHECRALVVKHFWIITCIPLSLSFLLSYSSQKTQIATKMSSVLFITLDPSIKFHRNLFVPFWEILLTNRQTDRERDRLLDKQTNSTKNLTSFYQGGNNIRINAMYNLYNIHFYTMYTYTYCSLGMHQMSMHVG